MDYLIEQALNGFSIGAQYALLALGLAIVFSVMGLVNFAHGEFIGVAGYAMFAMAAMGMTNPWLLVVFGVVTVVLVALVLERVAFRSVRDAPPTTGLLTAFGVGIVLQNLFLLMVSPRPKAVPALSVLNTPVDLAGFTVTALQMLEVGVTAVAIGALVWFLRATRIGLAMRAAALDFTTVRLMGMRANRVIAAAFAISGLLASIAAIFFIARRGAIDPFMGLLPVLKAFVACVLGGFGSLPGAVVGGLLLGFVEVMLIVILPDKLAGLRDASVFLIVGAILVFRPQGILGRRVELGDKTA
ncbi:branched-chain amino acid ABC transporter permease [Tistrella bauzanensis]|uniref:Branched-chain amino acid ABC transporter permease n=1 Tax=Tistrella arctica TaxID=3133430 RepID=A0ABU9YQE3_9PROT